MESQNSDDWVALNRNKVLSSLVCPQMSTFSVIFFAPEEYTPVTIHRLYYLGRYLHLTLDSLLIWKHANI